jgi:drug/metabolite transporter (DMT)-like permease
VLAGFMYGMFAMLLRLWRVDAIRATVVVSVVSLAALPFYAATFGFDRIIAMGFTENLIQAVAQGVLAGPSAIYLFIRSVTVLGTARASMIGSLVPGFALLIGLLILREVPTVMQVAGFAVVLVGFRLAQRA